MKKSFFILISAVALISFSCKKDASTFQGQVRYIVDSSQVHLPATGAIITVHENDTSKAPIITDSTDAEGIYLLENVPDGIWVVKGEITVDSITYVGVTDKLECNGKDFIAAPVDCYEPQ